MTALQQALEAVTTLIAFAGGPSLVCFSQRLAQKSGSAGAPCLRTVDPEWGRPLTKAEYIQLCLACRAYWHLVAARNDLAECEKGSV